MRQGLVNALFPTRWTLFPLPVVAPGWAGNRGRRVRCQMTSSRNHLVKSWAEARSARQLV